MPGQRERAERRPVVGGLARDRLVAAGRRAEVRDDRVVVALGRRAHVLAQPLVAAHEVVLPRELPRGLDRLRAARDEEDPVEVPGGERGDLGRELDRARVRVRPVGVEGQLPHLLERRLPDLLAEAVADVDGVETGERVEVPLAVRVLEVAAVAAHDHRHVVVAVAPHPREVHPEVILRELLVRGRVEKRSLHAGRRLHLGGRACSRPAVDEPGAVPSTVYDRPMAESRRVYSTADGDLRKSSAPRDAGRRSASPTPTDGVIRVARETSGRRGKTVTVVHGLGPASSRPSRATSSASAARAGPRRTASSSFRATIARRSSRGSRRRGTA